MEDKQLIREIQKGHRELLNTIIDKYYLDIYRFCVCLTGDRDEGYDLTQETFLKFIQYVDSYRYRNLKAYLFMIARNCCMDYFRNRKHEGGELPEEAGEEDDRIAQVENQGFLLEKLQKLPREQREAIVLYYYQELKLKDIAKVTGVGLSTVKSRIRQGTDKLRKWCREEGYEG